MTDLDDLLEFWGNITPYVEAPTRNKNQTWTMHTMAPDQFCICRICLNEARYVQSVLYHGPMTHDGFLTFSPGAVLVAAQFLPCGHWASGFVYTRRGERIPPGHPAAKETYFHG